MYTHMCVYLSLYTYIYIYIYIHTSYYDCIRKRASEATSSLVRERAGSNKAPPGMFISHAFW